MAQKGNRRHSVGVLKRHSPPREYIIQGKGIFKSIRRSLCTYTVSLTQELKVRTFCKVRQD